MSDTAREFRAAVEASDVAAIGALLHADIVFHSPVTPKPFTGRETVLKLLGFVDETFEDFRYIDELPAADDGTHGLVFSARVGERELQGIDLLRTGSDGLICEFTVMIRPLAGLLTFAQAMSERVAGLA